MIIPYGHVALTAASVHSRPRGFSNTSSAQVLISAPGLIQVAQYDGTGFTTTLNETVAGSPSWVEFVEPNKLFAVDETGTDLRIFNLDLGSGSPSLSGPVTTATGSSGVVHLEFSKDMTRMVGAGYGQGTVDIWDIEDGGLKLLKTIESPGEPGPVSPNQDSPHPHQSLLDPTGRFFVVNDLGTDELLLIDSADDAWVLASTTKTRAGCGPRHGAFYPQSDSEEATHYMVSCELSNQVLVYSLTYGDDAITFEEVQAVSTFVDAIPEGAAAGELVLSPDSAHVYVSNRLTGAPSDTLAHYTVKDGKLSIVAETPTGGVLPRMFSLDAKSSRIFLGNQAGPDGAAAFTIAADGSVGDSPAGKLPISNFASGENQGPTWIKRIR